MPLIGMGMDVCSVERIQKILDSPRAEKFVERVYTPAEREFCWDRFDRAAAFAARFAAKEALIKALGAPAGIRWRDIEVVRGEGAAPGLRLAGSAQEEVLRRRARPFLSMTHDAGIAAATVILEAPE